MTDVTPEEPVRAAAKGLANGCSRQDSWAEIAYVALETSGLLDEVERLRAENGQLQPLVKVWKGTADRLAADLDRALDALRSAEDAIEDEQMAHGCKDGTHPVLAEIDAVLADHDREAQT